MSKLHPVFAGAIAGITSRFEGDPLDWLEENVRYPHSTRSTRFDRTQGPWLNDIIRDFCDPFVREIYVRMPTGAGKTTLIEALTCWIISQAPGPTMITGQSQQTLKAFADSRLWPVLEACPPVKRLFPKDRHKKRNTELIMPHMVLFLLPANLTSAQEKSMQVVICDEAWRYDSGMLKELRARFHDRYDYKFLMISQGHDSPGDLDRQEEISEKFHWGYTCQGCNQWHRYLWTDIKFDSSTRDEKTGWNWAALAKSVRHECPTCGHVTPDTTAGRRALANRSSYQVQPGTFILGRRFRQMPSWAIWWASWADQVFEWVTACDEKAKGNIAQYRIFHMKKRAEPWADVFEAPPLQLASGGYYWKDYESGQRISNELARFMTIDRQENQFFYVIRAWRSDWSSMLLSEGPCANVRDLRTLQLQYKVQTDHTFMDSGYERTTTHQDCSQFCTKDNEGRWRMDGWKALKGSGEDGILWGEGKRRFTRPYGPPKPHAVGNGRVVIEAVWSNTAVKDLWQGLRKRGTDVWSHYVDVSEGYIGEINAEIKKEVFERGQKVMRWVPVAKNNHRGDCEAMQVACALMYGILKNAQEPAS